MRELAAKASYDQARADLANVSSSATLAQRRAALAAAEAELAAARTASAAAAGRVAVAEAGQARSMTALGQASGVARGGMSALLGLVGGSDLRGLTDDGKFLTAKSVKDALAGETLSLSTPDLSRPVQGVTLSANATLADPTNVTPGTNGVLYIKQAASGGPYTLGYHATWKPYGSTPSMPTTAGAVVAIMWTVDGAGAVRYAMTQAAAS